MLLAVLLLILAAVGVLVAAVLFGVTQLAWVSVLLCAAAALALVVGRGRGTGKPRHGGGVATTEARPDTPELSAETSESVDTESETASSESEQPIPEPETEPAEQDTDAADVLRVCESSDQVYVIDERPRYHLADCSWVGERESFALPVGEARELGFGPCAVCAPDSAIAASARAAG